MRPDTKGICFLKRLSQHPRQMCFSWGGEEISEEPISVQLGRLFRDFLKTKWGCKQVTGS